MKLRIRNQEETIENQRFQSMDLLVVAMIAESLLICDHPREGLLLHLPADLSGHPCQAVAATDDRAARKSSNIDWKGDKKRSIAMRKKWISFCLLLLLCDRNLEIFQFAETFDRQTRGILYGREESIFQYSAHSPTHTNINYSEEEKYGKIILLTETTWGGGPQTSKLKLFTAKRIYLLSFDFSNYFNHFLLGKFQAFSRR